MSEETVTRAQAKSWRTTMTAAIGVIILILGAISAIADGDPNTNPDWNALSGALVLGVGLFFARDHNVSSKAAGLTK